MFSTLQEFKQAALEVRNLAKTPSNEEFAMLYSLYKQATDGDCNRGKFTGLYCSDTRSQWMGGK